MPKTIGKCVKCLKKKDSLNNFDPKIRKNICWYKHLIGEYFSLSYITVNFVFLYFGLVVEQKPGIWKYNLEI